MLSDLAEYRVTTLFRFIQEGKDEKEINQKVSDVGAEIRNLFPKDEEEIVIPLPSGKKVIIQFESINGVQAPNE
ncbi:hypothetical protein [Bacillus sp. AG4(2022)]|uniref:hypothetical protein n=1 Tax=Bacillus sp. AG4(2022) TaxID=2962594 RepID=UPI0028819B8B|nr:hypothetical protein [Bacillus sp. AG4(2022)]MDT0160389.1 hypothetical protein [Bacillus sp. AG4(2022)]